MNERLEADFLVGGELDAKSVTDAGDLRFEGLAAPITADDQDEAFEEKALQNAIDDFMAGDRPVLFNHNSNMPLGRVESLELRPGVGLWMKALLTKPEPNTAAADIFNKIEKGVIRGLSTAGRFWRRPTSDAEKGGDPLAENFRIWKSRFREISITPLPVHPQALGAVAAKSFSDANDDVIPKMTEADFARVENALTAYTRMIKRFEGMFIEPAPADETVGS